jgi:hypothetical protein
MFSPQNHKIKSKALTQRRKDAKPQRENKSGKAKRGKTVRDIAQRESIAGAAPLGE